MLALVTQTISGRMLGILYELVYRLMSEFREGCLMLDIILTEPKTELLQDFYVRFWRNSEHHYHRILGMIGILI